MRHIMHWEGTLDVLTNLFRGQFHEEAGRHSEAYNLRHVLLANTGVLRPYNDGLALALDRFGLYERFKVAVGVSRGVVPLAYLYAGQLRSHIDIGWMEAASENFISFDRFWRRLGPVADIEYLCSVFRGEHGRVPMDQAKIHASPTSLYAGVTHAETGKPHFLDIKRLKLDVVQAIHASCAMTGLTRDPVQVGPHICIDGATSMTFPVQQVIERFAPTDLLVFANRAYFSKRGAWADRLSSTPFLRKFPREVREAHWHRFDTALKELAYLRRQKSCRYLIIWSDDEIGRFTRDPDKIRVAVARARLYLEELLGDVLAELECSSQPLAAE